LCSWADRETGYTRTVTVSIYRAADGEQRANEIRAMMREECPPGRDLQAPNSEAFEVVSPRPGEYAFVLYYLGHVRAPASAKPRVRDRILGMAKSALSATATKLDQLMVDEASCNPSRY